MADDFITVEVRNVQNVVKAVSEYEKKKGKALSTAIKVESFRLMNELKRGIRQADPGGKPLDRLTNIARLKDGRFRSNLPLKGLASSVKYDFDPQTMTGHAGWTERTDQRLKGLAMRYQAGFSRLVTDKQRKRFARLGGTLGKRSQLRRFFFLKKSTTVMKTPERNIVDPLYRDQKDTIQKNIIQNFRIKMQGGRI